MWPLCLAALLIPAAATRPQSPSERDIESVAYRFQLQPGDRAARIQMRVEGLSREELRVAMPIWKPGSYTVRPFADAVTSLTAADSEGGQLSVSQPDPGTWEVATGGADTVILEYELRVGRSSRIGRAKRIETDDGQLRYHDSHAFEGPATWLYIPDRLDVPHAVTFELPADWRVATGMQRTDDPKTFTCRDYDVFADCPFHIGVFERLTFEVEGIEHEIVLSGFDKDKNDRATVVDRFRRIVQASFDMMGPAPYERYVFLIAFPGGAGLEHLNSTSMSMMSLAGGDGRTNSIWDSLVAHEFFHLWNVKRLRPRALGPFDYGAVDPNRTRYLWVSEGFTSYYGDLLCVRAGLWNEEDYWTQDMARQINTLQGNPGRKKLSVAEASWTVWDHPYMRRGRTAPDYYNKGQLLALLLDVEIRDASDNRGSLDDVMRGLYAQCMETGAGFADGDVAKWCEKVAGSSFEDFFARYVDGTEELPFEATLAKIGLLVTGPQPIEGEPGRVRGRWKIKIDEEPSERALSMRRSMTGGR